MCLLSPQSTSTWPRTLCLKSNNWTQMTLPPGTSRSHCCNLCWRTDQPPCSSQASRTLYSVASPRPQLSGEGKDSNSAFSLWQGHYLRILKKISVGVQNGGRRDRAGEWVGPSQEEGEKLELRKKLQKRNGIFILHQRWGSDHNHFQREQPTFI